MKDLDESKEEKVGPAGAAYKVHVEVLHTSTAKDKKFVIDASETLNRTIDEAYDKLKESRRAGDQYFCHADRHDLSPYLAQTLEQLFNQGVCVKKVGHNKLEFAFDIDSDIGGAAR